MNDTSQFTAKPALRTRVLTWVVSVMLHAVLLSAIFPLDARTASKSEPEPARTKPLRLLNAKEAARLIKPQDKTKKPQPPARPRNDNLPKAPVVTLSRVTNEAANHQARFLATLANQTLVETRSRQSGLPKQSPSQQSPPKDSSPEQPSKKTETKAQSRPKREQSRTSSKNELREKADGQFKSQDTVKRQSELNQDPLRSLSALHRLLNQTSPQQGRNGTAVGTPEVVRDVTEGDETILNTRAYKHGWFFNRVIGALYQNWNVQESHRRHDPSGKVYGIRDRHTVVFAVLDKEGNLLDIKITKSSGAPHLDDEAIAAFRRAQPFPNPPTELVDERGRIEFPMGFNLQFGKPNFFRMR